MIKIIFAKSLLVSTFFIAATACASPATEKIETNEKVETTIAAENQYGYSKPGASVKLRHDFDGKINPGQVGSFSVDLIMAPVDGMVRVSFAGSEGLEVLSGGDARETSVTKAAFIDETAPLGDQSLQFRAQEDGRYYINAFVDVVYPNGQKQSRVITMPINVGTGQYKSQSKGVEIDTKSGRGIAVMSAEETIK